MKAIETGEIVGLSGLTVVFLSIIAICFLSGCGATSKLIVSGGTTNTVVVTGNVNIKHPTENIF